VSELLVARLVHFGQAHVFHWHSVRFLSYADRDVDCRVDIALNIGEFFGHIIRVTLVDDLIIVAPLDQFAEVEDLVNVTGDRLGELG